MTITHSDGTHSVKLQRTEFVNGENMNRFWNSEWKPDSPGSYYGTMTSHWGRVGAAGQSKSWTKTRGQWQDKVNEQIREGYTEIEIVSDAPQVQTVKRQKILLPGLMGEFVAWAGIMAEESIATYLKGNVGDLSFNHLDRAETVLNAMMTRPKTDRSFLALMQDYYNLIPTKLPARIVATDIAREFDFNMQADRIQQLKAALGVVKQEEETETKTTLPFALDYASKEREEAVMDAVYKTGGRGIKVRAMMTIKAPDWARFEKCEIKNRGMFFHGTKQDAVQHINREGLRPAAHAGGLMFGAGIYLADAFEKSNNYASGHRFKAMYLVEARLGKQLLAPDQILGINKAPAGHDSVFGKKGYTKSWGSSYSTLVNSEYVVYRKEQARIVGILWYS